MQQLKIMLSYFTVKMYFAKYPANPTYLETKTYIRMVAFCLHRMKSYFNIEVKQPCFL